MSKFFDKLSGTLSNDIIKELDDKFSLSELNSFLLALFKHTASKKSPSKIFEEFANNRFVHPSDIDPIKLKMLEIEWLDIAVEHNFSPIELSPVAPLGSSSVLGPVDQNNVVSASRNAEIVSDATNVLALKIAQDFKSDTNKTTTHYVATHRHVRGQAFDNPLWSAHFGILCMASGGLNSGNHQTELQFLDEHLRVVYKMLSSYFPMNNLTLKFYFKKNSEGIKADFTKAADRIWMDRDYEVHQNFENNYYQSVQFKIFTELNGEEVNLADGGLVDWSQQLLSNKKHRLFISGVGTDLILRLRQQ